MERESGKWVWFGNGGEDEGRMVLISFQWNHGEDENFNVVFGSLEKLEPYIYGPLIYILQLPKIE
jgi:hypothetical protein